MASAPPSKRENQGEHLARCSGQRMPDTAGDVVKAKTKLVRTRRAIPPSGVSGAMEWVKGFERRYQSGEVANEPRRLRCIHLAFLLTHTILSDHISAAAVRRRREGKVGRIDGGASRLAWKETASGELPSGGNGGHSRTRDVLGRRQRVPPRSDLLPHRMGDGDFPQLRFEKKKQVTQAQPASSVKRLPPCVLLFHSLLTHIR